MYSLFLLSHSLAHLATSFAGPPASLHQNNVTPHACDVMCCPLALQKTPVLLLNCSNDLGNSKEDAMQH